MTVLASPPEPPLPPRPAETDTPLLALDEVAPKPVLLVPVVLVPVALTFDVPLLLSELELVVAVAETLTAPPLPPPPPTDWAKIPCDCAP